MIISYAEHTPRIDPDAWVATEATVCGDGTIGAGTRIMHGARIVAEGDVSLQPKPFILAALSLPPGEPRAVRTSAPSQLA
jgi:carbonic anhydrase/acetyltransferase-like protein (isoleucine patch superfamily)